MQEQRGRRLLAGPHNETSRASAGQRYLAVAARLAGSQPSRHSAVSHVTIGAVAAAAGVSRGALYRLWPSQQDFWNDLIQFLEECPAGPAHTGTRPASGEATLPAASFYDAAQHVLLAGRLTLLRTATADMGGPSADETRVDERRAARLAQLAEALERASRAAGRRFSAGLTPFDFAAAVTALGMGLPIVGQMCAPEDLRFDSPWFERPPDGPRSMLGVATRAIRDGMTEPAAHDEPMEPDSMPAPPRRAVQQGRPPSHSGRRRAYLEMGARLATTRDGTAPHRVLGHVTLESVARAAGVTRRTVASVWPDQDAFRLDLFVHLLRADRAGVIAAVRDSAVQHHPCRSAGDAFAEVGTSLHRRLIAGRRRPTFRAYATQLDDPSLATRAMEEHRRLADSCTVQIQGLLTLMNRQFRAGVGGRQVAALLFALNDGFATLLRTSPLAIRDGPCLDHSETIAGSHGTISMTVAAVLEALTEPLHGSPDVSRYVALIC